MVTSNAQSITVTSNYEHGHVRPGRLESSGDNEVHANQIGEVVMESLAELDPVAYVRYASVYKDFREAADFNEFLEEIGRDPSELPLPGKKKSTKKK